MPRYSPRAKEIILARPDGRTREGRLLRQMRHTLFAHLGGEDALTLPQRALVERAAMAQLRLATLDSRMISGSLSPADAQQYTALANSLRYTLATLGLDRPAVPDDDDDDPLQELRQLERVIRSRQAGLAVPTIPTRRHVLP